MFEHSTRVPLIIADPHCAFRGHHYSPPVELVDVVPTVLDLLGVPQEGSKLDGQSLAPLFAYRAPTQSLFERMKQWFFSPQGTSSVKFVPLAWEQPKQFALSQKLMCAREKELRRYKLLQLSDRSALLRSHTRSSSVQQAPLRRVVRSPHSNRQQNPWKDCSAIGPNDKGQVCDYIRNYRCLIYVVSTGNGRCGMRREILKV